jgi:hypothetical protein
MKIEREHLVTAAKAQPNAKERKDGIKFECPGCVAEGHDTDADNAVLWTATGKWGCAVRPGHKHNVAIARALRKTLRERGLLSDNGGPPPPTQEQDPKQEPKPDAPYSFKPALPANHLVSEFIIYGTACSDAPLEFLEAAGLIAVGTGAGCRRRSTSS